MTVIWETKPSKKHYLLLPYHLYLIGGLSLVMIFGILFIMTGTVSNPQLGEEFFGKFILLPGVCIMGLIILIICIIKPFLQARKQATQISYQLSKENFLIKNDGDEIKVPYVFLSKVVIQKFLFFRSKDIGQITFICPPDAPVIPNKNPIQPSSRNTCSVRALEKEYRFYAIHNVSEAAKCLKKILKEKKITITIKEEQVLF